MSLHRVDNAVSGGGHKRSSSENDSAPKRFMPAARQSDEFIEQQQLVSLPNTTTASSLENIINILKAAVTQCRSLSATLSAGDRDMAPEEAADFLQAQAMAWTLKEAGREVLMSSAASFSVPQFLSVLHNKMAQVGSARRKLPGKCSVLCGDFISRTLLSCIAAVRSELAFDENMTTEVTLFSFDVPPHHSMNRRPRLIGAACDCVWYTGAPDSMGYADLLLYTGTKHVDPSMRIPNASNSNYCHYAVSPRTGSFWLHDIDQFIVVSPLSGNIKYIDYPTAVDGNLFNLFFTSGGDLVINYWRNGRVDSVAVRPVDDKPDVKAKMVYAGVGYNDAYSRRVDDASNVWACSQSIDNGANRHWLDVILLMHQDDGTYADKHKIAVSLPESFATYGPTVHDSWTCGTDFVVLLRNADKRFTVVWFHPDGQFQLFEIPKSSNVYDLTFDQANKRFVCYAHDPRGRDKDCLLVAKLPVVQY